MFKNLTPQGANAVSNSTWICSI